MKVGRIFTFEAAHFLPGHPKCGQMHGHSYKVEIVLDAPIDRKTGMVVDFGNLSMVVSPIIDKLDHEVLNDIEDLGIPTAENLCIWIKAKVLNTNFLTIQDNLIKSTGMKVKVWETATSWAEL